MRHGQCLYLLLFRIQVQTLLIIQALKWSTLQAPTLALIAELSTTAQLFIIAVKSFDRL